MQNESYAAKTALDTYFNTLNYNTARSYRDSLNKFLKFCNFEEKHILRTTIEDIKRYQKYLSEKFTVQTQQQRLNSLRSIFKKLEMILPDYKSPFHSLNKAEHKSFKITLNFQIQKKRLLKEEIEKINEHLKSKITKTSNKYYKLIFFRNYILFNFLLHSGLRISELINLKKSDIKKNENKIYAQIAGKGRRFRQIEIPQKIWNMLEKYWRDIKNEYKIEGAHLLMSTNKEPLHRKKCYKIISKLGKTAISEERRISPHGLRHTFAFNKYYVEKWDLIRLSRYLGHSSVAITEKIYIDTELPDYNFDKDIEELEI